MFLIALEVVFSFPSPAALFNYVFIRDYLITQTLYFVSGSKSYLQAVNI